MIMNLDLGMRMTGDGIVAGPPGGDCFPAPRPWELDWLIEDLLPDGLCLPWHPQVVPITL